MHVDTVESLSVMAYRTGVLEYTLGMHTIGATVDPATNEITWTINGTRRNADYLRGWLIRIAGGVGVGYHV